MSSQVKGDTGTSLPPYIIPVDKNEDVRVYHVHTPFNPPQLTVEGNPYQAQSSTPTYAASHPQNKFVSRETELGRRPGMTTCASCQQQVMTEVTYKVGTYAWLMCLLFILCGLVVGCCLIPFFVKHFKDAYHTCPRCQRILHVEKATCC